MCKKHSFLSVIILLCLASVSFTSCNSGGKSKYERPEAVSSELFCLDTMCSVSIYDTNGNVAAWGEIDKPLADEAIEASFQRCKELERILSNTISTSDISRINEAKGEWVEVSDEALTVIKAGIEYGELSDGDFDITIGTLTDIWDYHAEDPVVPEESAIVEALSHVDYKKIEIDGNRVRLLDPKAKLDLGGIAKGYISDEMTKVLQEKGITSAIINLGGNIVTIGSKPLAYNGATPDDKDAKSQNVSVPSGGAEFIIGVEKPYSNRSDLIARANAIDNVVITSGVYERYFEENGKKYHHVLSTKTGYPVETDLDAVSIVSPIGNGMATDAMTTICLIKGKDAARKLIDETEGFEAIFCEPSGTLTVTENFPGSII